jgi:8-oxo-dGTP pyrophosphatase MutT (NUDIX family)
MPTGRIRPLVLCLFRHRGQILVSSGYDSVKQSHYYRPLGGGIEFGETSRDALRREMREELGAEIEDIRLLGTLESLFELEGEPGHEIVFVFDAVFADRSFYDREAVTGREDDMNFRAEWKSVEELTQGKGRLVPEGLAALMPPDQG